MPGIVGGTVDQAALDGMANTLRHEGWYEVDDTVGRTYGLAGVHHGDEHPTGHTAWTDGRRSGVLHGVVSNRAELGMTLPEIFRAVLDRPEAILPRLSGPFLLAAVDQRGSLVLATDKLATRPGFYTIRGGDLLFGSELKALLPQLDEFGLDVQAVSDLLLTGYVMGEKTLVDEIRSLPPATYLQHTDGTTTLGTYWRPDFGVDREPNYVERAVDQYRRVVSNAVGSVEGDVGLWLSAGLDSRTMAAALHDELDRFHAFTYDAYHGKDASGAKQVADALNAPFHRCDFTAAGCLGTLEKGVDLMDGMNQWSYYVSLPTAVDDVPEYVDVMFEACGQGEFFGDVLNRYHLRKMTPVEALYTLKKQTSASQVRALLAEEVDPKQTFRSLVERSPYDRSEHVAIDCNWKVFANGHFRANKLYRSQTGTRTPFADGEFLDHVAGMPIDEFRQSVFPLTGGKVPYGVSPLKLEVMRRTSPELSRIPYDRTGLPPTASSSRQAAGFVATELRKRLGGSDWSMQAEWYRHNPRFRSFLDGLLDDACDRELFDGDAIRELQEAHLRGEANNLSLVSALTTFEMWARKHLDRSGTRSGLRAPTVDSR